MASRLCRSIIAWCLCCKFFLLLAILFVVSLLSLAVMCRCECICCQCWWFVCSGWWPSHELIDVLFLLAKVSCFLVIIFCALALCVRHCLSCWCVVWLFVNIDGFAKLSLEYIYIYIYIYIYMYGVVNFVMLTSVFYIVDHIHSFLNLF